MDAGGNACRLDVDHDRGIDDNSVSEGLLRDLLIQ